MDDMSEPRTRLRDDQRTDAELLADARREPEAFGAFYDRHAEELLAFFYRRTADAHMAADLTAETFAEAFASRERYRDVGASAAAWLFGIAKHELSRALRRRRVDDRARRRLGVQRVELDDVSIERIEGLVDFAPVRKALEALSPRVAEAISLRVGADLPYAEVARRLGCSEGAARVRVARGLAHLARTLEASP
jgi:RNA polymerase sigma-70 factor (ECF subfamily)